MNHQAAQTQGHIAQTHMDLENVVSRKNSNPQPNTQMVPPTRQSMVLTSNSNVNSATSSISTARTRAQSNKRPLQDVSNRTASFAQPPAKTTVRTASQSSNFQSSSFVPSIGLKAPQVKTSMPHAMNVRPVIEQQAPMEVEEMDVDDSMKASTQVFVVNGTTSQASSISNIDAREGTDPYERDYARSVHDSLKAAELRFLASPDYMHSRQTDITSAMRGILIDWLHEVCLEYRLKVETLFFAVNYVDRFLSLNSVMRNKLQLVGVTSMLIAAKYAEIMPPTVEDFVYITDNTYTRTELLQMESLVLNKLQFSLTSVTIFDFLDRYIKAGNGNDFTKHLAHYISELSLQEYNFVGICPSKIAAASVILALHGTSCLAWHPTLAFYSGFDGPELLPILKSLHHVWEHAARNNLKAVYDKYAHANYLRVSTLPVPMILPSL